MLVMRACVSIAAMLINFEVVELLLTIHMSQRLKVM